MGMPDTSSKQAPLEAEIPSPMVKHEVEDHTHIVHMLKLEAPDIQHAQGPLTGVPDALASFSTGALEYRLLHQVQPPLDVDIPVHKASLNALRREITCLLTRLSWRKALPEEVAARLTELLPVGPFSLWHPHLLATLFEIDRRGHLLPAWLYLIQQGDVSSQAPGDDPTTQSHNYARRIAILLLGYYKQVGTPAADSPARDAQDTLPMLQALLYDPSASFYAARALAHLGHNQAQQILLQTLCETRGWNRLAILEQCLALGHAPFAEFLLIHGIAKMPGLEHYAASALYHALDLAPYLEQSRQQPRLAAQAALVLYYMIEESKEPSACQEAVPRLFTRSLAGQASALFKSARQQPSWQAALALHALGALCARYWQAINQGLALESNLVAQIYPCLPMMPEIEAWMQHNGRELLFTALCSQQDTLLPLLAQALAELGEIRAVDPLLLYLESVRTLEHQEQAQALSSVCLALGQFGDLRATPVLQKLVANVIDPSGRRQRTPLKEALLEPQATDYAGSLLYVAVLQACRQLPTPEAQALSYQGLNDLDPRVRLAALETLRILDVTGSEAQSRASVRQALSDQNAAVAGLACQVSAQYHDQEAAPLLQQLLITHPTVTQAALLALHQLQKEG
ncbi:hypothetical protein KSB_08670 [Ktedonobacter robiniae]|uniref:HEAT repeat domain-containing protein n=2 Tax=Ktedonobacter robiniae TaxID=2778365 RepID=A0ABQ3UJ07_9CHLR|nr:hypothetical protein KSB_08670 [Ktedonobacter robiniae]